MSQGNVNPINPFRTLRNRLGISQYELARRAGITKHAILRLEQGCYDTPLPSILEYFVSQDPHLSRVTLMDEYAEFQYQTRVNNHGLFGDHFSQVLEHCPVGTHPFTFLRTVHHLNPTQVAKLLCIQQSTVVYFERNAIRQHTVPKVLIKALHDADYSSMDTDALESAYNSYRTWLSASKELTLV